MRLRRNADYSSNYVTALSPEEKEQYYDNLLRFWRSVQANSVNWKGPATHIIKVMEKKRKVEQ
jgi:hypothetical protein